MKRRDYSELKSLKKFSKCIKIEQYGRERCIGQRITQEDKVFCSKRPEKNKRNYQEQKIQFGYSGRNAPKTIIELADFVTEMKEIKHYFSKGVKARVGIEK